VLISFSAIKKREQKKKKKGEKFPLAEVEALKREEKKS
jgi:hypothetical protein